MDGALKLVATVLSQFSVVERGRRVAWPALVIGATIVLAAACTAAALGCAVSALWLAMLGPVGSIWATLIASAALLAFALALYAIAYRFMFGTKRLQRAAPTAGIASAEIGRFVAAHKGSLLLAAVVAGLLSANNKPNH
jgi:hypothetical protein